MPETQVQSLGREDPLEREMATHASILAWRIPWTEEPGGLQSMVSRRVRHYWVTNAHTHTHTRVHVHTHTHTVSKIVPRHPYGFGSWGSTLKALMKFSFGDFGTILQYLWDFYLGQSISIHTQIRNHQKTEIQAFGTSGLLPPPAPQLSGCTCPSWLFAATIISHGPDVLLSELNIFDRINRVIVLGPKYLWLITWLLFPILSECDVNF